MDSVRAAADGDAGPPLVVATERIAGGEEHQVGHGVVGEEGGPPGELRADLVHRTPGAGGEVEGGVAVYAPEGRHRWEVRVAVHHVAQALVARLLDALGRALRKASVEAVLEQLVDGGEA